MEGSRKLAGCGSCSSFTICLPRRCGLPLPPFSIPMHAQVKSTAICVRISCPIIPAVCSDIGQCHREKMFASADRCQKGILAEPSFVSSPCSQHTQHSSAVAPPPSRALRPSAHSHGVDQPWGVEETLDCTAE